jgi:uncharacterized membrane protein (DUF485 family)
MEPVTWREVVAAIPNAVGLVLALSLLMTVVYVFAAAAGFAE